MSGGTASSASAGSSTMAPLVVIPAAITVTVGRGWPLRVEGGTGTVTWSVAQGAGSVDATGRFRAAAVPGTALVTATRGGVTASAVMTVVGRGVEIVGGVAGGPGHADGPAQQARFARPTGMAMVGEALWVADANNHVIRAVQGGQVTTVAGGPGVRGSMDGSGPEARFDSPYGLVRLGPNVAVSERFGDTIRAVTPEGATWRLAGQPDADDYLDGPASMARFHGAMGLLAVGTDLLVADRANATIRRISGMTVSTWAGAGGMEGLVNGPRDTARFARPHGLASDPEGNVYVADTRNHVIRRVAADGTVSTLAGNGTAGSRDGVGAEARFDRPHGVAWHPQSGTLLVADTNNKLIRRVTTAGAVTTVAGRSGFSGARDGPALQALFDAPVELAVHPGGDVFISEINGHAIRRLGMDGMVTTHAGVSGIGAEDGPALAPRFQRPRGVLAQQDGSILVADGYNLAVRRIRADGQVTTVAGRLMDPGSEDGPVATARFRGPFGLAQDDAGNLYVSDMPSHAIRVVGTDGMVRTLVGQSRASGYVEGTNPQLSRPRGVAWNGSGIVFADGGNHVIRVAHMDGTTTLLAGTPGMEGHADGAAASARFDTPHGIALGPDGSVFVADQENRVIRRIHQGMVTTVAGQPGMRGHRDGPALNALFDTPTGLAIGEDGALYVADNRSRTIRRIMDGQVTTVAGQAGRGTLVPGPLPATLGQPVGIAVTPGGDLVVADRVAHAVVLVRP